MQRFSVFLLIVFVGNNALAAEDQTARKLSSPISPVVEIEEDVYTFKSADNGAGPMWCYGSTCLVRVGERVFASGLETLENVKPLNNCRWLLFGRGSEGWKLEQVDEKGRTREPCPLVTFSDGRFFLSANPTLVPDLDSGPARPEILEFSAADPKAPYKTILPTWQGTPKFTEHSYRSFAADGPRGEMLLMQNIGMTHSRWAFRDAAGKWSAQGKLAWPWGADYEKPQPIRTCYPTVALKNRAVHFCGVSDIVEPKSAWRAEKFKQTGRKWDYDFRRLFYTWTPEIGKSEFRPWVEIASREETGGWLRPCDLWVDAKGAAHLLWCEKALDERLREKFFPEAKQSRSLEYAVVREGKVASRRTLLIAIEDGPNINPGTGRFHITPDDRLFVLMYVSGTDKDARSFAENRLIEILPDGSVTSPKKVPLETPFTSFFIATPRAGCAPSKTIDIMGLQSGKSGTISYAKIRLEP
ncbi:MAG: hypothetical protein JXM70_00590 [Pirellulales bacterium]|nr:hypothetical protein [Pirellulales bacterium]